MAEEKQKEIANLANVTATAAETEVVGGGGVEG